ncbi:sperm-associated antigen 17-like isoform X3 [Strongylocentrotus purpuratus]|uniref:Sperm-associated antigen 17 n=1 Tax=Strongylocentrotus purpuratus TaxID=7668 RepID=A0A7M7MZK2_STRPU|nr:sperm-associated antigen 17-like isoform X3 [Strongylocentrotus purpuratus]
MSKKRAKSGAGSAGVSRWESGLLSTNFEEEGWKACISFLIGNKLDDKEYASILSSAVDSRLRRLFTVIHKDTLMEEVNELGNSKTKKGKDAPQFFEICETVKSEYLDKGEEIPQGLMAKLLKWKLLAIKEKDLKRREEEKKALENKDVKGGKGAKEAAGGKRARSKSPAKGKGKKSPEVPSPKKDSKLKKRGEEDDDNKYIDDEPDDGPQHYVIIEGFEQAPLLSLLTDLGINVNCIIRLLAEDYSLFEKRRKEEEEEMDEDDRPLEVIEEEKKKKEAAKERLEKFWLQHEPLLKKATKGSKLQDIARLTYTVKNLIVPDDLKDNEKRTQFGTDMFEDVACMMYDLLDSERQYRTFLDNMKLIQVPVVEKDPQATSDSQAAIPAGGTAAQQPGTGQAAPTDPAATAPELKPIVVSADVDTRYYNELMDSIPQESMSIPLVMHCMLEQVVATSEDRGPPSDKDKIPREDGLDQGLAAHIDKMAAKLHITDSNKVEQSEEPPNGVALPKPLAPSMPEFFQFGDDISLRLKHLQSINGFNAMEAELAMLDYIPVAKLREFPRPSSNIIKQRAARLQELLHHLSSGVVDPAEVDRAFKQFVFESLVLRGTEEDGCVSQKVDSEGIVWDDPYPLFSKKDKDETLEKEGGDVQTLTAENVQKNADEFDVEETGHQTNLTSTGILKPEGRKSRQGSASSLRSGKSTGRPSSAVHFEKDASGYPIIHPKDPAPPSDSPREEAQGDAQNEEMGCKDAVRPGSSKSNISIHDVIGDTQLRNLDEWCYAEHFEAPVLIQILEEAREMYPFMDTYYHKRDHTLLVVMHNPVGPELKNTQPWDTKLHSDVGFRNYMEHVSENISDWVNIEETKYQAEMRQKDLARQRELALSRASTPAPSRPSSSKSRKGSAKKSRSKSPKGRRSASPAQTVDNLDPNSGQFMRPGSMKAWKVEQDKIREEEEKKRLEKEKKAGRKSARSRSRSASPVKKGETDDKKDKKPGSASKDGRGSGSRKGDRDKKESGSEPQEDATPEPPKEPEREYKFVGYDMGNNIIQANGNTTTLFPNDGGQIRSEHTQFINGPKFVKTSVLKDGHVFVVHILDPRDKEEVEGEAPQECGGESNKENVMEKADQETQEKDQTVDKDGKKKKSDLPLSSFGSFTANLSDGMVVSFSNHGIDGKTKGAAEKKEIEVVIPPASTPTPTPVAPSPKGKRGGSGKKGKQQQQQQQQQQAEAEKQAQLLAEQQQKEEEERRKSVVEAEAAASEPEIPPFQQLFVSCPDGLHVSYMLEPTEDEVCDPNVPGCLLIRQSYLTKNSSGQPCDAPRENPALQEISRLVTSEGSVIKMLRDGSTQVLFANGAVSSSPAVPSSSTANPMSPTPRDQSPLRGGSSLSQRSESPSKRSAKGKISDPLDQEQPLPESCSSPEWITTTPTGQRIGTRPDGTTFEPTECLLYSATDPVSGEVLTTREDRVITVERPNKMRIVDHNEGTRITTYYKKVIFRQQCDEANETGEIPVSGIRDVKHVKVECVGYATVIFNCEDSVATTIFGNGSEIIAIPDGSYEILHCEGSRMAVGIEGTVRYTPKEAESGEPSLIGSYTMQHNDVVAVETCDSDGNHFGVKWNGDIYTSLVPSEERKVSLDGEGEEEEAEKVLGKMSPIPRFFVIHPDGSGTEMLRQQDIAPYVHQAGMDPNVAVLKDPIPDHPEINGITIMQPHTSTVSQKWLNRFEEPNIIPRNLRSRGFDKLPAMEAKTPGPKFGTKVGKGVAVNNVPRPQQRGPVPQCPKQLQLRQFVAYHPMEKELRGKMKEGLEAYAKEMKEKMMVAKQRAIKDPRSQQERVKSGDLLAHILAQLEDDIPKESDGTQPTFTEAPPASQGPTSTKPVRPLNVQAEDNAMTLYEMSTAPPPQPAPPRPKPKYTDADWERVRREHEEEKACRDALLTRTVPPYFESDWGKAFKRAEEAVANGEPAPDMEALTKDLPANRPGVSTAMSLPSTPADSPAAPSAQPGGSSSAQPSDISESISPMKAATAGGSNQTITYGMQSSTPSAQQGLVPASPSDTRPNNPTPGHATGQGTPTALRPTNPTPAHASHPQGTGRPVNPTPQSASEHILPSETPSSYASFPAHPSTIPEMAEEGPLTNRSAMTGSISPELKTAFQTRINDVPMESRPNVIPSAGSDIVLTRSLLVDVNGEPRQDAVRLPAAILGQKPGALPNSRFDELEDSVRRKIFTSSIAGAQAKGMADLSRMRGFELVPGEVNFGTLREGCTYAFQVNLKNVGVDSCRYKVRQPPPGTGLQVVYTPGPVAAGMKAKLELVLYAIAVGVEGESGHGSIDHHIEITTETELMYLPVSADILTAAEYDERTHVGRQPKVSPGIRLIATRPPSREGIIRPRKDIPQQSQENLDI